ncbi:hypothetical protein ABPG72_002058 [Tetrahymena utriculariae]
MLKTKLKSIFSASYLKQKLDSNFEKSFNMVQDIAKQLISNNDEYFIIIVLRISPETLTYKAQMILKTLKLLKLTSLDNINLLDRLALKQRLPYLLDAQTQLDLCVNFLYDNQVYQSYLYTLNEDIVPCLLETKKVFLSQCEISKGIFLPDICIIEKFTINPNIINALLSENTKKNQQYFMYDLEESNQLTSKLIYQYILQIKIIKQLMNRSKLYTIKFDKNPFNLILITQLRKFQFNKSSKKLKREIYSNSRKEKRKKDINQKFDFENRHFIILLAVYFSAQYLTKSSNSSKFQKFFK